MSKVQSPSEIPYTGNRLFWLVALVILSIPLAVQGESQKGGAEAAGKALESQFTDFRTLVKIPEKQRLILQV